MKILSPVLFLVFLGVVCIGTVILMKITERKWGYTGKREKELEKLPEDYMLRKRK